MLQVRLLGQFDVRVEGKRVSIPTRAGQSLFAFLVLHPGVEHRREHLAGLFWPDSSDENARRSLRTELWRLRKALGTPNKTPDSPATDYLFSTDIAIVFNHEANYWLDAAQLAKTENDLDALTSTVSVYRGELLPGFYDDWVTLERERLHMLFEAKMQQLLDRLIAEERWSAVHEWSEKWLALDPAPEPAYRALMLAYGARGETTKVNAVYQRAVQDLREQLDAEPSAETRALYEGLRQGSKAPVRTSAVQPFGTVTFLFSDIEGSTRLLDSLGTDYAAVLDDQQRIMRAAIQNWNGHEEGTQGDSFFVSFARAIDAVQCAVQAQRALAAHSWLENQKVRVRMGMHTGEPLVASSGFVGMDVHRAARIGDAGHGGQVLLSQTTRELVQHELPPGVSMRELGEFRLKDLKFPTPLYQLDIEGLQNDFPAPRVKYSGNEPPAPGEPPFKGLEYFDERDADLFFGRERLTESLVARVQAPPLSKELTEIGNLSVVVGASGSGKSSLVRAGVIPALKRKHHSGGQGRSWRVYVITPTAHPLEALATALTQDAESVTATATLLDDLAHEPRALHLFLGRQALQHNTQTLLVIDQFEELFTLCRDEFERVAFIDNLLDATAADPAVVNLVITLRADFYAHLAQYPELREAVAHRQEFIGPMNAEELRSAIQEPAMRTHWDFEPGLVDLILRDVGDEPGALPLLSHALLETWKRRAGNMLTFKGYADAGGVRGAIAQTAEASYQQLTPEQQEIARDILLRLTELGNGTEDTRRRASFDELLSSAQDAEQVRAVLNLLAQARLITLGQNTAEVAHEALIREWDRLREWLNQDREGLRLHRSLTEAAQDWELMERDASALYRGARLAQAREWAALHPHSLNAQERAFLDASNNQEQHEQREKEAQQQRELAAAQNLAEEREQRLVEQAKTNQRLRQRAIFLATMGALAIVLAGIAVFLGKSANDNAVAAQSAQSLAEERLTLSEKQRIVAEGTVALEDKNSADVAALLAMHVLKQGYDESADRLLLNALEHDYPRLTFQHKQPVTTVDISPDGKYVLTGDADKVIRLWDAKTGQAIREFAGHSWSISDVNFFPDGKSFLSSAENIRIWDAETGKEQSKSDYVLPGRQMALSPDGKYFASGDLYGPKVRVWENLGTPVYWLEGHIKPVITLQFSSDGTKLLTAGLDGIAILWDMQTGKEIRRFSPNNGELWSAAFSLDGKFVAIAGKEKTIWLWDSGSGKLIREFVGHQAGVNQIAFLPNDKYFVSTSDDGSVRLWDIQTGEIVKQFLGHQGKISGLAISRDGKYLVSGSADGKAMLWEIFPKEDLSELRAGFISSAVLSPDGKELVVNENGTLRLYDAVTGEIVRDLVPAPDEGAFDSLNFSSDGSLLFARLNQLIGWTSGFVWRTNDWQKVAEIGNLQMGSEVVFSPDSKMLVSTDEGQAVLWAFGRTTPLQYFSGHPGTVGGVAFSPDGKYVAATSELDNVASLYDLSGKEIRTFVGHTSGVEGVDFSPDGKQLVTASQDKTVRVWDVASGTELLQLGGHTAPVRFVKFSPDGMFILSGGDDRTARLWDVVTRKQVREFTTQGKVTSLGFYPDGKRVFVVADDGKVRVWRLDLDQVMQIACARLSRELDATEIKEYDIPNYVPVCPKK